MSFTPPHGDIGFAVLGAGRMAQTHLRTLGTVPGVKVVVVADPDEEAARAGAQIARADRSTTDPMEAIHDPDVHAVAIVTPTDTHATLITEAIKAGKAVWTEKPIDQSLAATRKVVDLWNESSVPVQVGFMRRYDPGYARAKALIDAGELGRIEQFRAYSRDTYPPSVEYLLGCGGSFLDMSVHDLDAARFLVGEVETVHAWADVLFDERFAQAADFDTAVVMMRFDNGALGVVETSRHSEWGYDIRAEVAGALGKVVVDGGAKTPAHHMGKLTSGFSSTHDLYESFPDRFADAYRIEMEEFVAALREGRTPEPGPQDALESLRLAVACTLSWRQNRPVRIDEIGDDTTL